jgi:hypothetical protein
VAIDDMAFETMLVRARRFRQRVHRLGVSRALIDGNVAARLRRTPDAAELPAGSATLVEEIVRLLDNPELSPQQTHKLERTYFGE